MISNLAFLASWREDIRFTKPTGTIIRAGCEKFRG